MASHQDELTALRAIEAVLERYLRALHESDADTLGVIFHPCACLHSVPEGAVQVQTRDAWIEKVRQRPSPLSQGHPRDDRVIAIQVMGGDMASATVHARLPPRDLVDQLLLLRTEAGWRIVAKCFRTDVPGTRDGQHEA
jgi:hypothetical protein